MKAPLISIITPSYNQVQFLEESIQSVLNQDYPSLEYLVVDGGSADGSLEIIQKYADRLAWWVSEKDSGQADAVNKGLARAKGKYIGWLNSDDLYKPGAVRQAVELLEANPRTGFVFGDVESIDAEGRTINVMQYGNWHLPDLMRFRIIGQPGVFMRREVLEAAGGLDLSYHYLLDHHLWLRMALEADMQYSGRLWASARFHAAAKNVAQAQAFGQEAYRLVEWMDADPRFRQPMVEIGPEVKAGADRMNARYLLDGGQNRAALKAYFHGLRKHTPTVLVEWHRIVYAFLSLIGLGKLKHLFYRLKFLIRRPDRQVQALSNQKHSEE